MSASTAPRASDLVGDLAARGRYHFTSSEVRSALGVSEAAARQALSRLAAKGEIASPARGFYVIVPPEYRRLGCLPADQFIPALMVHRNTRYYVGLLSAAQYHGAAHHRPQEFQVVVEGNRPAIVCGDVRVVDEGQTVLIYCPLRKSVEPFADVIVDLHERGALRSLLQVDAAVLNTAVALGEEWLGPNSAILKCLRLGVALHHGALPTGYRKEIERLLQEGVLRVTISSPTLSQGLNLSATALVMYSLHRNRKLIETSEFRNVSGRAGRAYVDMEGIVLFPMFDKVSRRRRDWDELITDVGAREMESGLVLLVMALLKRMHVRIGGDLSQLLEYVVNNAEAWTFPEVAAESPEDRERALTEWERHVARLDTAILSLIGENDVPTDGIEAVLDDVLQSSLWQRRLLRLDEEAQQVLTGGLISRSKWIWGQSSAAQRRGYFLAGVGLMAGQALDGIAAEANSLLVGANAALLAGDTEAAINAITCLAERVFGFYPFTPEPMPANWRDLLRFWLLGEPLAALASGQEPETLHFIEGGLVYRLPWAMEAVRVRADANGDVVGENDLALDEYELGLAVPAVETGTMNRSASILIQAGFNSRLAAIKAVTDTGATFKTGRELTRLIRETTRLSPDFERAGGVVQRLCGAGV